MKLERIDAAFDDFRNDAKQDRMARWPANVSERS
jgi:hypothetical protein